MAPRPFGPGFAGSRSAMTANSIVRPPYHSAGRASIPATGTVQRRFVRAPQTTTAIANGSRTMNGIGTAAHVPSRPAMRVSRSTHWNQALGRITNEISNLWALNLPMTELQREYDATGTVTLDQVLAAAKKYVLPASSSILLVGDRAKIEPGLKALNLGEIVVLDVEGKPVVAGTK